MPNVCTIATISSETGIAKEVLRKWEERYGFPVTGRDAIGHRTYARHQIARLKLIKRLIDHGMRPAQVVSLDEDGLKSLLQGKTASPSALDVAAAPVVQEVMALLLRRERDALREKLQQEIARRGLEKFVLEVMCSLTRDVGAAWERGELAIRDEHLYSEVIQSLIREAVAQVRHPQGEPRILIATPSGELHTLGILMVEALASLHGACCISLGAQMPVEELAHAVDDHGAEIVCLCFSAAYPKRRVLPLLKTLRAAVPKQVEIWIGGAGAAGLERSPRGINVLPSLSALIDALEQFGKARHRRLACGPSH